MLLISNFKLLIFNPPRNRAKRQNLKIYATFFIAFSVLLANVNVSSASTNAPTVATLPSSSNPVVPAGLKVTCLAGPNTFDPAPCPVLQWNGYTYWALSYIDNRNSFAITAFDAAGNVASQFEATGSRYVNRITVDDTAQTATFYGQSNQTTTSNFAQLEMFSSGAPITAADLTALAPALPVEPPAYNLARDNPSQEEFARFAWRNFIHLNSPAKPASGTPTPGVSTVVRDTIDPTRGFIDSGDNNFYKDGQGASNFSSNLLLWETYAHRTELLPKLTPPLPTLATAAPTYRYQNLTVDAASARFNSLDENAQIGQNIIFFPKNGSTPSTDPFDDYQILFEAKVNVGEYDYVKSFFGTPPTDIELPPNASSNTDTIEIKAAWRVLTPKMVKSGRYHMAEALYFVGDEGGTIQPTVGQFGLIGLHIIRKMNNYPVFVYSTFEHQDNLVTPKGDPTGLYFLTTYDDLAYDAATPTPVKAVVNNGGGSFITETLPVAGAITSANGYNIVPGNYTIPSPMAGPVGVVKPPVITDSVTSVNTEVKTAMATSGQFKNSVWQYYNLKGVQAIPINEPLASGTPTSASEDFYLANNVIESSQPGVQLFKGGVAGPSTNGSKTTFTNNRSANNIIGISHVTEVNMGGCMGCHGNAKYNNKSIFNFLLINKNRLKGIGYGAPETIGEQSGDEMLETAQSYLLTE